MTAPKRLHLKPREQRLVIRDPKTLRVMPAKGAYLPDNSYYRRRMSDGDALPGCSAPPYCGACMEFAPKPAPEPAPKAAKPAPAAKAPPPAPPAASKQITRAPAPAAVKAPKPATAKPVAVKVDAPPGKTIKKKGKRKAPKKTPSTEG